jgi:hypothetical protein
MRAITITLVLAAQLGSFAAYAEEAQGEWEQIIDEDGVRVWKREVPGSAIVEFKSRARIEAPIIQLAAVLRNTGREKEWMESCVDSRVVQWLSSVDAIIYNRTASPVFFVSDRDLVVRAKTSINAEKRSVRIDFVNATNDKAPAVDGVVRMPKVVGHWELFRIDERTSEVEYQIQADPGGELPAWLVNWASERIPFNTLVKMRAQAKKDGYDHDIMILERAIDWSELEAGSKSAAVNTPAASLASVVP